MNVFQSFLIALEMLRLHKLRAFLTMLGVIIGVMSVTIIVMVSSGFQFFMANQFNKAGANEIMVMYDNWGPRHERVKNIDGLKVADVKYLEDRVTTIDDAAPLMQISNQKVINGDKTIDNPRIYATDQMYTKVSKVELDEGHFFDANDVRNRANVCVIGTEIRDRLFSGKGAVGKYVTLNGIVLEVIGVEKRLDMMGQSNSKDLILPISTAQDKWVGGENLMMIMTTPRPGIKVEDAMQGVWEALMQKSGNKRIYRVESNESILNVFGKIFGVAGVVLAAIAALSLLVGGIGIMNIMLVSVTERTKEIGLRKAVGAKRAAVLTQFIVESSTLSLVGGLIGMGCAWCIGKLVTLGTAAVHWPSAEGLPTTFPLWAAVGAGVFSALIGLVFGLYPAMSAASLDPIVALRTE